MFSDPSISFNIYFGAQKSCIIEKVLFNIHNICFGLEIRKFFFFFGVHS